MECLNEFLIPSLLVFTAGLIGVFCKKNMIAVFMCLELMLCGATLALVSFSSAFGNLDGAVFAFFALAVAAAEVALALAIVVQFYKLRRTISASDADNLGD